MRVRTVISAVAVIVGGVMIHDSVVIPWSCNLEEQGLQDATIEAMNQRGGEAAVLARENLELVRESIAHCPRVPNFYMIAAANYRLVRRLEDAAAMYETALTLERRPEIYFQLALTRAEMGMHDEAIANFVRACRFVPVLVEQVPTHLRDRVRAQLETQAAG